MSIEWVTLGINAAISLFLSLIVFSLGLRAGKERMDRKHLREKYREIYAYLNKFKENIESSKPLFWRHFIKSVNDKFTPFLEEKVSKGEHVELSSSFFPGVVELERDCLQYGFALHSLSLRTGEIVIKALEENNIDIIKDNYRIKTNVVETEESGAFFEINAVELLLEKRYKNTLERLINGNVGVDFRYVYESHIKYDVYIKQVDIKQIDIKTLFTDIRNHLIKEISKDQYLSKKEEIINKIDLNLKRLEKKIKEPYSFWATIGNTFKDIFR